MAEVASIGVYGFTGKAFLRALKDANVALLLDVRQRRGVRGSDYAWANSRRLQDALAGAGIAYRHIRELAPTTELRRLQYAADAREGVGKRSRVALAPEYVERYTDEVLTHVDLAPLVAEMPADSVTAILCVERDSAACHRSLIAARLEREFGLPVRAISPPGYDAAAGLR